MLQFVFLRKEDAYEKVKETCLEYAGNQNVFASLGQEEQVTDQEQVSQPNNVEEIFPKDISEKVNILCQNFELLALVISKDKTKKNFQDITCHKCKKPIRMQFKVT